MVDPTEERAEPTNPMDFDIPSRRRFLKRTLLAGLGVTGACAAYPFLEARSLIVREKIFVIPRLPDSFKGLKIAFHADIHHGPLTWKGFVHKVVRQTMSLEPDLILLGGDYVHADAVFIRPCFDILKELKAPLGVHAVLGNHDHWEGEDLTRQCLGESGFTDLTNTGIWLERGKQRLRVAGVGDLWEDSQDLESALGDAAPEETAILLAHNPDYTEEVEDPRVGLILSGHTHGGQVNLPFYGAPIMPSAYGQKYRYGLVRTKTTQVYVTSGIGTIYPPARFCARPEILLATLT